MTTINDINGSVKKLVETNGEVDRVQVYLAIVFTVLLIVILIPLTVITYWLLFDDNPPAVVFDVHMHTEESVHAEQTPIVFEVKPGEKFFYGVNWCKFTNAHAEIRRSWQNDTIYTQPITTTDNDVLSPKPAVLEPGCRHSHVPITVPNIPPDEYMLNVDILYSINPLIKRSLQFDVGPIHILDEEKE